MSPRELNRVRDLSAALRAVGEALSVSPEPFSLALGNNLLRQTLYLLRVLVKTPPHSEPPPKTPSDVSPSKALEKFVANNAWDPEPDIDINEPDGCRALLLGILRRAAYDWVLYRSSGKLAAKQLADDAHHWLFEEDVGTYSWRARSTEGRLVTAFVSICDSLELDPDAVRDHIRKMTVKGIMSVGRPPERHRVVAEDISAMDELPFYGDGVRLDELPSYDPVWHEDSNREINW